MFSQTTTSHFITLFCLWVNILSIIASPLPYENRRSPPSVQFGPSLPRAFRKSLDFRCLFTNTNLPLFFSLSLTTAPRLIRDLRILTFNFDQRGEHSSLLIGTTCVHALTRDRQVNPTSILTPEKLEHEFPSADFDEVERIGHRVTSLGKASFRDQAAEQEAIDKILEIKLPRFDQGGNCMDFIRLALGVLIRKKNAVWEEVMPGFEKVYEERTPVIQRS